MNLALPMSGRAATLAGAGLFLADPVNATWAADPAVGGSLNHDLRYAIRGAGASRRSDLREKPMFHLLFAAVARAHHLLQTYTPTNRLLTWLRRRENLRWGVPFMLLGAAYLPLAATMTTWARDGGPAWADLVFLVAFLDALKFLLFGPVSLVLLARAHLHETAAQRRRPAGALRHASTVAVEAAAR